VTLLISFGLLDADHSAFSPALMVGKDKFRPRIVPGFLQQTGEHPQTLKQLN
jgi:hypothetical protein